MRTTAAPRRGRRRDGLAGRAHEEAFLALARGRPARLALDGPGEAADLGVALVRAGAAAAAAHAREELADALGQGAAAVGEGAGAGEVGAEGRGGGFGWGGGAAAVGADFGFRGGGDGGCGGDGGGGFGVCRAGGALQDGAHVACDVAGAAFPAAVAGLDGFGAGAVGCLAVVADCLAPAADPVGFPALVSAWEELLPCGQPVGGRRGVLLGQRWRLYAVGLLRRDLC